ncbi:MAG: carbon-nitrogen hydrolase family protein [Myxococcota bacterium]|nr:carbon-nitrogen hydrolase family protein [Myxococcota bacterium]
MAIIAAVQINGTSDIEGNLRTTERLVREAAGCGATFVATPESTTYLGPHDRKIVLAEAIDGPINQRLANLARELRITLLVGSVAEKKDQRQAYNTSVLFGPDGSRLATYRKMHLFDVDLSASGGVSFRESDTTGRGADLVVAQTPVGAVGLSICFDLRFPELYRALCDRGAEILAVPSAFTMMTGKDHWHTLLRARAIENQAWVIAPAQWGPHDDQGLRLSYGHSVIIDPWGTVVAECSDGEGFCMAAYDPNRTRTIRGQIPMGANRML